MPYKEMIHIIWSRVIYTQKLALNILKKELDPLCVFVTYKEHVKIGYKMLSGFHMIKLRFKTVC